MTDTVLKEFDELCRLYQALSEDMTCWEIVREQERKVRRAIQRNMEIIDAYDYLLDRIKALVGGGTSQGVYRQQLYDADMREDFLLKEMGVLRGRLAEFAGDQLPGSKRTTNMDEFWESISAYCSSPNPEG